jgi:hypothetical protein
MFTRSVIYQNETVHPAQPKKYEGVHIKAWLVQAT